MVVSGHCHAPTMLPTPPPKWTPSTNWIGGWVDLRVGLNTEVWGKINCLCWGMNPGHPVCSQTLHWLRYLQENTTIQMPLWINSWHTCFIFQETWISRVWHKGSEDYFKSLCNAKNCFASLNDDRKWRIIVRHDLRKFLNQWTVKEHKKTIQ
jgi:hypothetical protein